MPVRQRLLLVLPDGEMYDYTCQRCNNSVGSKTEKGGEKLAGAGAKTRVGGF